MWVNYPPDFGAGKRCPVLLLHGGPHNGVTNAFAWRRNAQLFAALGYVVAWHNFHGSSGFGQAFADSINPKQDELLYSIFWYQQVNDWIEKYARPGPL